MDFKKELESLINRHSKENDSDTPDFILARYMNECLLAFNTATQHLEEWYGGHHRAEPGGRSATDKQYVSSSRIQLVYKL
ncbi:MAG TPA: hypothetical protein ENI23_10830 [bacterium]|nr:hypothetical protein [bacterium]